MKKEHLIAVAVSIGGFAVRLVIVSVSDVLVGLLEFCIGLEVAGVETLTQMQIKAHGLDVVGCEVSRRIFARCLQPDAEDTQIIEAHGLALQQHLAQADFHLDEYAPDGALTIDAVVLCHVLYELVELHQLMHGATVPLPIAGRLHVNVFVLFVVNHNGVSLLGFCGTIADAKVRREIGGNPAFAPYGLLWLVVCRNKSFCLADFE